MISIFIRPTLIKPIYVTPRRRITYYKTCEKKWNLTPNSRHLCIEKYQTINTQKEEFWNLDEIYTPIVHRHD